MSFENPNYNYENEPLGGGSAFQAMGTPYGFPGAASHLRNPAHHLTFPGNVTQEEHSQKLPLEQYGFPHDPRLPESSTGSEKSRDSPDPDPDYLAFSTFNPLFPRQEMLKENTTPAMSVDNNWVLQDVSNGQKARQFIESMFQSPIDERKKKTPMGNFEDVELNGNMRSPAGSQAFFNGHNYEVDSTYFGSEEDIFTDFHTPAAEDNPRHVSDNSSITKWSEESVDREVSSNHYT